MLTRKDNITNSKIGPPWCVLFVWQILSLPIHSFHFLPVQGTSKRLQQTHQIPHTKTVSLHLLYTNKSSPSQQHQLCNTATQDDMWFDLSFVTLSLSQVEFEDFKVGKGPWRLLGDRLMSWWIWELVIFCQQVWAKHKGVVPFHITSNKNDFLEYIKTDKEKLCQNIYI